MPLLLLLGSWQHRVRGASEKRAVSYLQALLHSDISISAAERVISSVTLAGVTEPCYMSECPHRRTLHPLSACLHAT